MKHIPLVLAVLFLVFAMSGCLVPSTSVGNASNDMRCSVYNTIGYYPNDLAVEGCK